MIDLMNPAEHRNRVLAAGLPQDEVSAWLDGMEGVGLSDGPDAARLATDAAQVAPLFARGWELCAKLPLKTQRSQGEKTAGESIVTMMANLCRRFCDLHVEAMYDQLTGSRGQFLRVDDMAWRAAELWPGVLPSREAVTAEAERMQADKDGLEIQQGIFFSRVFANRTAGTHLTHASLRPKAESLDLLEKFRRDGVVDLGQCRAEAHGEAGYVITGNPRFLNAEDDTVLGPQETAIDLVLLHPDLRMGILRGAEVDHPRYKGRRIFSSGINLTKIYHGDVSFLFYLVRDLGLVNKLYRGLAGDHLNPDAPEETLEKPWLAAVDTFAIGGGCQLLLVVDYVIAEAGSYFNLPARKEGIIPGLANMRLPRFLGERVAHEAIMFDRTFYVDSPDAAGLVSEVVPRQEMDGAVQRAVDNALGSGMVSAAGNRKALRVQAEPIDDFRRYMATYAVEQAYCHLSEQLVHNLEKHWNAKSRQI